MFSRLVAVENINLTPSLRGDLPQEFQFFLAPLKPVNRIMLTYGSVSGANATFDAEVGELMSFVLTLSVRLIDTAERFMRSLPPSDPDRATRVQGLEQMKSGLAQAFNGALVTLSERDLYRISVLGQLAKSIADTLPRAFPSLSPSTQQEFCLQVRKMASEETEASLKSTLEGLAKSLSGCSPPAGR